MNIHLGLLAIAVAGTLLFNDDLLKVLSIRDCASPGETLKRRWAHRRKKRD